MPTTLNIDERPDTMSGCSNGYCQSAIRIDLLRCGLAEYRGLILQVDALLTSNVAPSFNTTLLTFLWNQVAELEQKINQTAVEMGDLAMFQDEDIDVVM